MEVLMTTLYSLYILVPGKDKPRKREVGIATVNKDSSLTCHFDVAVPTDVNTGYPVKVFLRKIEAKPQAQPQAEVQQELDLAV